MLDIDRDRQRISLGLKQTQEDPWQRVVSTHRPGDVLEGTVTKVVAFGAFVEILPGVEGLVHISELADHHVENPSEVVEPGTKLNVKILEIDEERRRLSLSIKQVEDQNMPMSDLGAQLEAAANGGDGSEEPDRKSPREARRGEPAPGARGRGRSRGNRFLVSAMPLTIGLTGGIAAGKSEALAAFERLGAATISSDAVVHELLDSEPLLSRLTERWGDEAAPAGRVDRTKVGEIVFADPEELTWLEAQIHPLVGGRIGEWLGSLSAETEVAVVEVPLLFEAGMEGAFDTTVAVVTSDEVRRARAEARGHALVGEREARQLAQEEKAARAEHVVENDGTVEDLERALSALVEKLRE